MTNIHFSRKPAGYYCLEIEVPEVRAERVYEWLAELGGLGWEEFSDGENLRVLAYFPAGPSWERRQLTMANQFRDLVGATARLRFHRLTYDPTEWVQQFKAHFHGFQVADSFWIRPPWEPPALPPLLDLCIEPGHGFGTGTHESTRLALTLLVEPVRNARAILDVGTGSGILAVAAAKLNPSASVVALDIDPLAASEALRTCDLNKVGNVLIAVGGPEVLRANFDITLANLTASLLSSLRRRLATLTRSHLVLSGITEDEQPLVEEAFRDCGWTVRRTAAENDWRAMEMVPCTGS
ncbi:MAG TPA: 50S ribosomal protein L11 methyltransferase [Acidobacteriota bacterium]|nr:50S ribosomal protein L11 methyltransferase [Acidobacteriota bacterium]